MKKSISQCDPEVCQGPILPDASLIPGSTGSPRVAVRAVHCSVSEGAIHVMALLCDHLLFKAIGLYLEASGRVIIFIFHAS